MTQRVAVTGLGVVTPLGNNLQEFTDRLLRGVSAGAPISIFDPAALETRIAAQVDAGALAVRHVDRKVAFGVAAARAAVTDANAEGVPLDEFYSPGSGGLSLGIGLELFSMPDLVRFFNDGEEPYPPTTTPLTFLQTPADICIGLIAREHALNQPPLTHISACAAATDAIGSAHDLIRHGERKWMLAGGTDSMINPMGVAGFCKIHAMTRRNHEPEKASRPFDRDRDGFLLGEGAGLLVLEPLRQARERGARVYAEICGYGNSFDAHGISEPHPEGEGALLAMARALESAQIRPGDITYVNAHGTATPKNDPVESLALGKLLGAHAGRIPVSSTKSMIGHLISAAGAVETIAAILCGRRGFVHPTINLDRPARGCDLDYVAEGSRKADVGYFLKNSFAFGGQNAALVVRVVK